MPRASALLRQGFGGRSRMVPLAGIEPALLAELDFESSASTSSATGAHEAHVVKQGTAKRADYIRPAFRVNRPFARDLAFLAARLVRLAVSPAAGARCGFFGPERAPLPPLQAIRM